MPRRSLRGGVSRRGLAGLRGIRLRGIRLGGARLGGIGRAGVELLWLVGLHVRVVDLAVVVFLSEGVLDVVSNAGLELSELPYASTDLSTDLRELARAEHDQRHDEDHEDLERADLRQSGSFRGRSPTWMVLMRAHVAP